MSRRWKACVLIALLILVPLRTIAAVVADCDPGQHEARGATHAEHSGTHHHHDSSAGDHCGSAAFAAPPASAMAICPVAAERFAGIARLVAGPVLDRPNPPPLPI